MGNLSIKNNITSIRFYRYGIQGVSLMNDGTLLNNLDNYTFKLYDKNNNIIEDNDIKCESDKGNIVIKYFNPNQSTVNPYNQSGGSGNNNGGNTPEGGTSTIPNYTILINSLTPNLDNISIQYKINNGNYTSIQVGETFTVAESDTWKVEAEAPIVAGGTNYSPYSISGTGGNKPNIDIVLTEADIHTIEITEVNTLNGALKFYNGNTSTYLQIPYLDYYYDGFAIRLMAAAEGYAHQMIIDTEDMSDDISTSIDLTPISTNDLFVSVLNNSTQHTNHYISVQENGTSIIVYPRVYYLQAQYRTVNVDLIIDHDGDFDIILPENGRYYIESTINSNTIIYDVYFSLSEEDTEAEFTISNSVKTYTINLYF